MLFSFLKQIIEVQDNQDFHLGVSQSQGQRANTTVLEEVRGNPTEAIKAYLRPDDCIHAA